MTPWFICRERQFSLLKFLLDENIAGTDFEAATLASLDVDTLLASLPAKQRNAIRATTRKT